MLAALLGQPIHEELCHRHRGRNQKSASSQFMFNLLLSVRCLLLGGKTLPFVVALAVFIFVGVADAVRIAALRNICHPEMAEPEPTADVLYAMAEIFFTAPLQHFGENTLQLLIRLLLIGRDFLAGIFPLDGTLPVQCQLVALCLLDCILNIG